MGFFKIFVLTQICCSFSGFADILKEVAAFRVLSWYQSAAAPGEFLQALYYRLVQRKVIAEQLILVSAWLRMLSIFPPQM